LADLGFLGANIKDFYNHAGSSGFGVGYYLGPSILRGSNTALIDFYDLDLTDAHHYYGSPVGTYLFNLASPGNTTPLPNELAACVSYRADYGSDPEHDMNTRPRADDRARLYLGPLNLAAIQTQSAPDGTTFASLAPGLVTTLQQAITYLLSQALINKFQLSTWSRKKQVFKDVAYKAADDKVDVQRRREVTPGLLNWVSILAP
jgi:hypothetical protein